MLSSLRGSKSQSAIATAAGFAGVSLTTFLAYRFGLNLASTVLLHLLIAVVVAFSAGFWQATMISIFANLSVNYFIIPPTFSFRIADTQNWVALIVFEFTVLVVSRLSNASQVQAKKAAGKQQEIERLYEFSRELLLLDRCKTPEPQIANLIERLFSASAVGLLDLLTGETFLAGAPDSQIAKLVAQPCAAIQPTLTATGAIWVKTLRSSKTPRVRLAARGQIISRMTFDALASLTLIALERSWSFENESRAEAERQAERLRSAVLDALAHEYKTPLTIIRTASSGFLALHSGNDIEEKLISQIDLEARKLDNLTSRLLQTSRLDSIDVKVRKENVDASAIVRDVLLNLRDQLHSHNVRTHGLDTQAEVYADPELVAMALSQIVDNATKYSDPGSTITVTVVEVGTKTSISVHSVGPQIPSDQMERIFDRFYRSPHFEERAGGTGLGLSVTRRIMEAHGGEVGVINEQDGNTFSLTFSRAPQKLCIGLEKVKSAW